MSEKKMLLLYLLLLFATIQAAGKQCTAGLFCSGGGAVVVPYVSQPHYHVQPYQADDRPSCAEYGPLRYQSCR